MKKTATITDSEQSEPISRPNPAASEAVSRALSARTRRAVDGARADETVRKYTAAWKRFTSWCHTARLKSLPASENTIMEFLAERGEAGCSRNTLKQDQAAIYYHHRAAGEVVPDSAGANAVVRYYAKQRSREGYKPNRAAPLFTDTLAQVIEAMQERVEAGEMKRERYIRNRAILVVGEYMMGRRSEIASLDIDGCDFVPDGVEVFLPQSKTDQDAVGEYIALVHSGDPATCPVEALRDWLDCMAEQQVTRGAIFRHVNKAGVVARAGLGMGRGTDRSPRITGSLVRRIVLQEAKLAGLPNWRDYSGHSMRRGAATQSLRNGADIKNVQRQGRWKSAITVVEHYQEEGSRWRDNPMLGL